MVDFKITKTKLLKEHITDMAHNYYVLKYARIYNEDKTKYRKIKWIEFFDIFDVMEYFEINRVTKEDVKNYYNDLEAPIDIYLKNYDDKEGLKDLYKYCNETIEKYNKLACFWGW